MYFVYLYIRIYITDLCDAKVNAAPMDRHIEGGRVEGEWREAGREGGWEENKRPGVTVNLARLNQHAVRHPPDVCACMCVCVHVCNSARGPPHEQRCQWS